MSTVLVVEDETNIRKFVTANLKARGYNVVEAPDAEQGLQQLRTTKPTVMLLDIMLPGMDGWSLLALIKDDPYLISVPVIVMTAYITDVDSKKAEYPNVVDVIFKPVSAPHLVGAVQRVVAA
jgi:two-component system cell cycle response regulator DivK